MDNYNDLFQTQADVAQNNFTGYPNQASYMNGKWGIDPNLLNPAFNAPYRPGYDGPFPFQYQKPTFMSGFNALFNPAYQDPYWGNPVDNQQANVDAVASKPYDAMAWGAQRIVAPAIAFGAAAKMLGPNTGSLWGDIRGTFTGKGVAGSMGKGFGEGMARAATGSMGIHRQASAASQAWGAEMRAASSNGVFSSVTKAGRAAKAAYAAGGVAGMAGAAGTTAAGVAGAAVGGVLLPIAAAEGVMWGAEKAVFDPYINNRKTAEDLRRNFANVSFADPEGQSLLGKGLGGREAAMIAENITKGGIQDMMFSTDDYRDLADFSARAGLMDNVKAKDISKRVKDVSEQVKIIMQISKDPDILKAIEEISKLSQAGASVEGGNASQAASAYRRIGSYAQMAGANVQKIMATVGAQGQYQYQQNGLTPYLGQIAAARTYAGFASAQRLGLVSEANLARMGGLEGATQSSMAGMVNGSFTQYNQMRMFNQYLGKGKQAGVVANVAAFGQAAAQDGLGVLGSQVLHSGAMASNQLDEEGVFNTQKQAIEIMNMTGVKPSGKDGKYSAEQVAAVYKHYMHLSDDQVRALTDQQRVASDINVANKNIKDMNIAAGEQLRSTIQQEGLYQGVVGRSLHSVAKGGRRFTEGVAAAIVDPITRAVGGTQDFTASLVDQVMYGSTLEKAKKVSTPEEMDHVLETSSQRTERLSKEAEQAGYKKTKDGGYEAPFKVIDVDRMGDFTSRASEMYSNPNIVAPVTSQFGDGISTNDALDMAKKLNLLAAQGNKEARAYFEEKDPEKRTELLSKIITANKDHFGTDLVKRMTQVEGSLNNLKGFDKYASKFQSKEQVIRVDNGGDSDLLKRLDTLKGEKGTSRIDALNASIEAFEYEKMLKEGKITEAELKTYVEKNGSDSFKRMVKSNGGDVLATTTSLSGRMAETGMASLAVAVSKSGLTMDAVKKNPNLLKDPKLIAEAKEAISRNDDKALGDIIIRKGVALAGGVTTDDVIKNASGMSREERVNLENINVEKAKMGAETMRNVTENKVDFTNFAKVTMSLDKSAGELSQAATKLKEAAEALNPIQAGISKAVGLYNSFTQKVSNPSTNSVR